MGFEVRKATMDDIDDIVQLWVELSIDQLSKDPFYKGSLEFKSGYTQMKRSLEDDSCAIFVAVNEGSIEGFIEIWTQVEYFQFLEDDCAYIVHCIFRNQKKSDCGAWGMISKVYFAAEHWAREQGKQYITADVFGHNVIVTKMLGKTGLDIFKKRMVRKI